MTTTTPTHTNDRRPCRACEELLSEPGAELCRPCGSYGPRGAVAESVWLNAHNPTLDEPCAFAACGRGADRYDADGQALCRWHAED